MKLYERRFKRFFDVAASAIALAVLSPVLVAIALCVRIFLGAPVLFVQMRPGRGGRPFQLLKFRTMTGAIDESGAVLPDAARLTTLGRVLRAASLDELPELVNVLRGDMSIVGPRPLLMEYLPRYNARQARRHDVRPGITGLAQIRGRNALPWDRKFECDLEYVDGISFLRDLEILALTLVRLVTRDGVNQPGHATAGPFMGTKEDRCV